MACGFEIETVRENTEPNSPPSCYSIFRRFNDTTGMNMVLRSSRQKVPLKRFQCASHCGVLSLKYTRYNYVKRPPFQ